MAEEIDDNEFFQQDFTTASEWEVFNARLDEIFLDWKLPFHDLGAPLGRGELFQAEWQVKTETIFFADVELAVSFHCVQGEPRELQEDEQKAPSSVADLMSLQNNFGPGGGELHPMALWYGLRSFVVIEPTGPAIVNESQYKVLLSSASISVAETDTKVPVFVRVMRKDLDVFLGVCEYPSTRIHFDIIALEKAPLTCQHLTGLLTLFKGKIRANYIKPATVSLRLTFALKDFPTSAYAPRWKMPFAIDSDDEEPATQAASAGGTQFFALPYGVSFDPVSELVLHTTWPEIAENVVVDSATYSDLSPLNAPEWSLRANFSSQPIYHLSAAIKEFLQLVNNAQSLSSVVGSSYDFGSSQNLDEDNPLVALTEKRIFNTSSVFSSSGSSRKEAKKAEGVIKNEELMQMLYYLFPDAEAEPLFPYGERFSTETFDPLRIKSAAPNSLVIRLSALLATCNSHFGGVSALGQIWAEFTQEVRYRVERCIQIPGVSAGFPDSRTCLLHQKLQLLNICMERRRLREGGLPFAMEMASKKPVEESEGEDEFFDCATDDEKDVDPAAPWNKPAGRLERLDNLKLIDSDEGLYVPVTQEPVPKTEDQLEDDAEVMLKLGPGSELCAQMMSASLLSDMASFKAANPNGKLEDFIRWYSPRDWIEELDENGEMKGSLSARMSIPGNTWLTVWEQAKPVPAKRQKRLFDDTKEAEKILHFFETRTIGQICQLTLAALFHSAVLKLKDEIPAGNTNDDLTTHFDKLTENLCKLSREGWKSDSRKWSNLRQEIEAVDAILIQSKSLLRKGISMDDLSKLLGGLEVEVRGAPKSEAAEGILRLFKEDALALKHPVRKEYVLRLEGGTTDRGVGGPQFLRAILDKQIRLCGAFSDSTIFV